MHDTSFICWLLTGVAIVMIGLAIPLVLGKVPPNKYYGVRFSKSYASESNWYAINRHGGYWLVGCGVATLAVAAAAFGREVSELTMVLLSVSPAIFAVIMAIGITVWSRRLP